MCFFFTPESGLRYPVANGCADTPGDWGRRSGGFPVLSSAGQWILSGSHPITNMHLTLNLELGSPLVAMVPPWASLLTSLVTGSFGGSKLPRGAGVGGDGFYLKRAGWELQHWGEDTAVRTWAADVLQSPGDSPNNFKIRLERHVTGRENSLTDLNSSATRSLYEPLWKHFSYKALASVSVKKFHVS